MRLPLLFLLFATSAFAQNAPPPTGSAASPGCGPANVSFDMKSSGSSHPVNQPEPGKALLYFLQEDKVFESRLHPTVKWIGATQSNRYFYISVDPGEHHLCSEWQTAVIFTAGHPAAARFTAEAGQAYYFRTENYFWKETGVTNIKLGQLDSDEALLLMSKLSFSESKAKKVKPHLRSARAVALRCGLCYFRS